MRDIKTARPEITAAKDEFIIRKILSGARLAKAPIDKFFTAPEYPLGAYEDFMLKDLTENIRLNGIITPVLAREINEGYEIVDGAARFFSAKSLGETELEAKLITCSSEEAVMIAFEANICRRSIRDLKPSVQAKVISDYYYGLKSQGRRTDLIYRAAHGEDRMSYDLRDAYDIARNRKPERSYTFAGQKYKGYDVRREVSARYGMSGRNVARWLRINKLNDDLKQFLDAGKLGFTAAVNLSYLSETQQRNAAEALADGAKAGVKNSWRLKEMALKVKNRNSKFVNRERIRRILLTPDPQKEAREEEDYKAAAMAAAKAAGAKIPGEEAPKYDPIENIDKYLKDNYPKYFLAASSGEASEEEQFVRSLIKFFVAIKDRMCFYFPVKYKPETPASEILKKIYQATLLYFSAVISGKITPPAEAEM